MRPDVDATVEQALAFLFDRDNGTGPASALARKLVKRTLIEIGMAGSDFLVLEFSPTLAAQAQAAVRATRRAKIRNHIAGDRARLTSA